MPDAIGQRRVLQRQRGEQRVARHFHVHGGVVQIGLGFFQIEQAKRNLVLNDAKIGAGLGGQRLGFHLVLEALAKAPVVFALVVEGGRAHVVELLIQVAPLKSMQAGGGGRDGRESQRGVDEFVGELGKALLGGAASGDDQSGHEENEVRREMAHGLILQEFAVSDAGLDRRGRPR